MQLGTIARVFGIVYLLIGILGFVPGLAQSTTDPAHLVVGTQVNLLGIFPVNVLHNLVHILVGLGGLALGSSIAGARSYFRTLAVVYGLLTLLGLIPLTNTVFGLVPIFGADIALHLVTAIAAGYLGWGVAVSEDRLA